MNTLDFGVSTPYNVRLGASPVYECALAIAAFTRDEIHDKLEWTLHEMRTARQRMSTQLQREIGLSGEVHTWRNLLFLAHRCPYLAEVPWEQHIGVFLDWITEHEGELPRLAAPYLGEFYATELETALSGNLDAQQYLVEAHSNNPVIHLNLRYLFSVERSNLLSHLHTLLSRWYEEVSLPRIQQTMLALHQDKQHAHQLTGELSTSELIRVITKGSELQLLPGVDTLWLIPQFAYRPFTIINYLPRCVVYYYPVSDEFLPGGINEAQMMHIAALHKALGDIQRIRLLCLIRHIPKSLGELTITLNATKSNVHHHLTLLRAAGFVRVENGVYSINTDALSRVGTELPALLGLPHNE